jgi:ankyrin repeat protein
MVCHGLDLNSTKDFPNAETLLHLAVRIGTVEAMKFILGFQVELDIQNKYGETPLHLCCGQTPKPDLARMLIIAGASTSLKNALGDTPISLAKRCGHQELVLLLQSSENAQS